MELVREDADQKESKSNKQIRKLQGEIEQLQDHIDILNKDLSRTKKDSNAQSTLLRRQLQESRETLKRFKNTDHGPSALSTQVEKRHSSELRGLGKQIRYLKAKLFREETFRCDLQYAKNFFLMQINSFESLFFPSSLLRGKLICVVIKRIYCCWEQMGIYPDSSIREKRPRLRSVALFFIAIARMKYLPFEDMVNI